MLLHTEIKYYLGIALLLILGSLFSTSLALVGFALFLSAFALHATPGVRVLYRNMNAAAKVLSMLLLGIIILFPSLYLTAFLASSVIFLGSYFVALMLFTACRKLHRLLESRRKAAPYLPLILLLYLLVGSGLMVLARFTVYTFVANRSGKVLLFAGIVLGISFVSTAFKVLSSQRRKFLPRHPRELLLHAFLVLLFSFLAEATWEGILLLKTVANAGLVLFMFGIPLLQLWRMRHLPHESFPEITAAIFGDNSKSP